MGITSKWYLLCMGINIIYQAAFVEGDYLVGIKIHAFESNCINCGTYFRYCVRSFSGIEECLESHQHVQPGVTLDFSQEFLLLRHNPFLFRGPTKDWQGVQIYIAAHNRNSNNLVLMEARVNLTTSNTQLGVESAPVMYTGPTHGSNLTASYLVTCAEYWYGEDCNYWCQDFRCMCDLPVPCHDNCVGVVCGENRHCVDGVDVYVCTCDAGFVGRRCEVNVNECEGVNCSGNGQCRDGVDAYSCECDDGYSGAVCEIADANINTRLQPITTIFYQVRESDDENTLPYISSGVVGWILFVILGMIIIATLVTVKIKSVKRKCQDGSAEKQQQKMPSDIISTNPAYSSGAIHQNISYPKITRNINYSAQLVPERKSTTVNITHAIREGGHDNALLYSHGYELSEELYEDIA